MAGGIDQRNHYRINDRVEFEFESIKDDARSKKRERADLSLYYLMAELRTAHRQNETLLQRIAQRQPEIASYLEHIDEQIERLAKIHISSDNRKTRVINISAGGVAFNSFDELKKDSWLKLKLILLPSYEGIVATGQVVGCKVNSRPGSARKRYRIAVKFVDISENDQDVISRHILKKQAEALRRKNDHE